MDYLSFNKFISSDVLIVMYYLGAIVLPIRLWYLRSWLVRKLHLLNIPLLKDKQLSWHTLGQSQKIKLAIYLLSAFVFMELIWRMLFEYLIAYMQIRDALVVLHR